MKIMGKRFQDTAELKWTIGPKKTALIQKMYKTFFLQPNAVRVI